VIRCDFVNPLLEPRWNDWVREYPDATFFHSAEWGRVLAESYNYPLQYLVARDSNSIVGILPIAEVVSVWTGRRGVSLPFSDVCPPLLAEGLTLNCVIPDLAAFGRQRRWDYVELRGGGEGVDAAVPTDEFFVHDLRLESQEDRQFSNIRESHRRNIRKAQQSGVEVHRPGTVDALEAYYTLHCLTRRSHGLPPQPLRFFRSIQKNVLDRGHGFVLLGRFEDKWIAGAVYIQFGHKAIYKYGASDRSFQHVRANNLVMWEAIRRFGSTGCKELSFGRTDFDDQGLLQFKRGWGPEERRLSYHRVGARKKDLKASGALGKRPGVAHRIMQRAPIPLLRFIGALTYRHVG